MNLIYMIRYSYREESLQDQLRQAKESISTMHKLHELAQSQLFELRAQSGDMLTLIF
jgi:hypothetical protein